MKWPALGLAQLWICSLVRIFTWSQQNPTAPWGAEGFGSELHKTFPACGTSSSTWNELAKTKQPTEWTLPTESWHIPLMLTDRLSGRTSLFTAKSDSWRLRQAGVTYVTDSHEGTLAFCGTLPQARDNAVAQLHEEVDIDLIKQRLGAARVQALTVVGLGRKLGAGPWGQLE